MLSKILRITPLIRQQLAVGTKIGVFSNKRSHLTFKSGFLFADEKKQPTKNHPKPINPNEASEGVDGEMKAAYQGQKDDSKQQGDKGIEPTQFGNTMLIISAIALALAYAYMEIQIVRANKKKKPETTATSKVTGVGKAHIGGDWELVSTEGTSFSNKDLEGKYYLIYFGFTHCPDICPNSLTKLAKAVAKVKKSTQANFFDLKTIFVSVDPDRDSPEVLKKFTTVFDPEMIGVTGVHNMDPALRECMKKFKIYASKLQFEDEDDVVKGRKSYTIDHTILTYLMSDTNEYLAHLGGNLGQHDLTTIILDRIAEDKRSKMKGVNG